MGGTLIFSNVGSDHFWGSKFSISIFLGVFRKMNIFWLEDFVDIFWGSSQNWTSFHAFLGLFSWLRYRMGICFGVAKISNIVLGTLCS